MELEPIEPTVVVELYLADREQEVASSTLRSHKSRLTFFIEWCQQQGIYNLNDLTGRKLSEYRLWRRNDGELAPASENCQMDTLRVFIRWLETIDGAPKDLHEKVRSPPVGQDEGSRDVMLASDDAEAVLSYLETYHYASLSHVMLSLLWHTMMRRGAAHGLDIKDYHADDRCLEVLHRPDTGTPLKNRTRGERLVALGGAVSALLASPHKASILEEGGVEFGIHKDTRSPVVIDPFAREDGYAKFTVGDPGSGKSFGSKQNFIRTIQQDPDRIGVILEPLNNWTGVAEALGGQRITVGGTLGLNPLEIKPTPEHVLESRGADASPLKERRNRAVSFFANYFVHRDVALGERRTTLELAIDQAYERKGITEDVSTHSRESPTVRDVLDILEEMHDDADEFVVRVDAEGEKIQDDALWLLDQLRPFAADGQFANLGRSSEFDIRDEKVIYLDLQQQGGSIGGHTSLLMELLISLVYERAKETEKEVVFVIDESRYLMKDAETLEYLETIFRHHRHHDLSIQLVTQTVDEFFQHDVSKIILDQCAIKQFHKLDGMNREWADEFGLNHAQMRFVQDAIPGSDEKGYSQALVGVDGEWRGIEVSTLFRETAVIENEVPLDSDTSPDGDLSLSAATDDD